MQQVDFVYHPAVVSGLDGHQGFWIYFSGDDLLLSPVMQADPMKEPPWTRENLGFLSSESLLLGKINDVTCQVVRIAEVPEGWQAIGLRDYLIACSADSFKIVNAASQLLFWLSTQNYCSRCGESFRFVENDRCLSCPACSYKSYPKISPCIIVLVVKDQQLLLVQSHRYRSDMYSCLAGFIECGESAEEAVHREVAEESGLRVTNIQYHSSQAWPFPHQLMLGYIAEHASGELKVEQKELRDAGWFHIDELPNIPPLQTIARQLIETVVQRIRTGTAAD